MTSDTRYLQCLADAIKNELDTATIEIDDKELAYRHIDKAGRMLNEFMAYVARYNRPSGTTG